MIDRDRKMVDGRRRERRKEEYERRCLRVFKLVDSIPQPGLSVRFFRGRPRAIPRGDVGEIDWRGLLLAFSNRSVNWNLRELTCLSWERKLERRFFVRPWGKKKKKYSFGSYRVIESRVNSSLF